MLVQTFDQRSKSNVRNALWIPRSFSDRAIEPETLRCVLEAARQTRSHGDEQPWRFIVATKNHGPDYERLLEPFSFTREGNPEQSASEFDCQNGVRSTPARSLPR